MRKRQITETARGEPEKRAAIHLKFVAATVHVKLAEHLHLFGVLTMFEPKLCLAHGEAL
jgi:hypothetical protein